MVLSHSLWWSQSIVSMYLIKQACIITVSISVWVMKGICCRFSYTHHANIAGFWEGRAVHSVPGWQRLWGHAAAPGRGQGRVFRAVPYAFLEAAWTYHIYSGHCCCLGNLSQRLPDSRQDLHPRKCGAKVRSSCTRTIKLIYSKANNSPYLHDIEQRYFFLLVLCCMTKAVRPANADACMGNIA